MGTGPLYLIPLKVCNIRARTVTVCGACSGSSSSTKIHRLPAVNSVFVFWIRFVLDKNFSFRYHSDVGDFIVEDTYKAGAFRIHFAESVRKRQTRTSHGECSDFSVTDCQRDEVERAGVRCNKVPHITDIKYEKVFTSWKNPSSTKTMSCEKNVNLRKI